MSALRHPSTAPRPRRAPTTRSRPPLHAVQTAPRARRNPIPRLCSALSMVLLIGGIIGVVALNALAAEASFEARSLEAAISDLTLAHDDLVAEVASLEAPGRVREVAGTQLGLIEPEQPGFLTLDPAQLAGPEPKGSVRLDPSGQPAAAVLATGQN